ncbi:MAG: hypothetical protein MK108_05230 [Mariniblastus sp.]|nr:hypothetical protein [Mariniblastus sp.]
MKEPSVQLEQLQRINVVGTSSTGKSTFARRIADLLDAPHVELDRLFWQPGWQPASPDRFQVSLQQAIQGDRWVIDGNYNDTRPIEHDRLTALIWLDYSLPTTLSRAFRRAVRRSWTRQEIWPGTGNCESFRRNFASRDSVLLWTLTSYYANRKKYRAMLRRPNLSSMEWIHLQHPRQAERFLQSVRDQISLR